MGRLPPESARASLPLTKVSHAWSFYLVLEAWKNGMGEGEELYNKPFNFQEGLLSEDDLDLIADLVWPETES